MNLIKFDVHLSSGEVRHVMAESERDCIEWFESHMLKPTSVVVQSNPSRWDEYIEIPRVVREFVVHRHTMLQKESKDYEQFGRRVLEILLKREGGEAEMVQAMLAAASEVGL